MELYALQLLPGSPWVLSSIFNLLSQRSLEPRLRRRRKMSYQCYANNGSLYENTPATYVPCNLTAVENGAHSSCCNVNDLCMTNGLCMEAQNEKKGANHYWRNGCTDPTFKDPACPNFCRGKGMYAQTRGLEEAAHIFSQRSRTITTLSFSTASVQKMNFAVHPKEPSRLASLVAIRVAAMTKT